MIYQRECRFCGTETEWAEPHLYHLSQNHPKREWASLSVCRECEEIYGPPVIFEEWETVRFDTVSCHFCHTDTITWVGTTDWANPKVLLHQCVELMNESTEAVTFTTDFLKQVTKVTSICHECTRSKPETEVCQVIEQEAKQATLERPMWEPIENDDVIEEIKSRLDDEVDET